MAKQYHLLKGKEKFDGCAHRSCSAFRTSDILAIESIGLTFVYVVYFILVNDWVF